jgi:EAL domain-containing protein (putative c-di-GMP-specific phosphodiesterase class I)
LVEAMVALASTMRLQTIAEGIETPEQLDCLCALRYDTGQGFLFSKPMSEPKLSAYLAHERVRA